jgi:hypothetical protein
LLDLGCGRGLGSGGSHFPLQRAANDVRGVMHFLTWQRALLVKQSRTYRLGLSALDLGAHYRVRVGLGPADQLGIRVNLGVVQHALEVLRGWHGICQGI